MKHSPLARSVPFRLALATCSAVILGLAAQAQLGLPVAGPYPLGPLTTGSTQHAAAASMDGKFWVGGNATPPGTDGQIHELTATGTRTSSTPTCPVINDPSQAPRDFAIVQDPVSVAFCLYSVKQDKLCCYEKAPNGGLICRLETTLPVPMDALAYDSASGQFYGALGMSPLTVFTVDPQSWAVQVVATRPPSGKLVRGLAWNPTTGTLWAACANNPSGGNTALVEFNELNPATGALTGASFLGLTNLPAPNVLAGCEIFHDVRNPGKLTIAAVHRSAPDALVLYNLESPFTCNGYPRLYCTGKTNSAGCVPQIGWIGAPSASATSGFTIRCTQALNSKPGLLFYSPLGRAAAPFQGGIRCVANPMRRGPNATSGGSPPTSQDCSGVLQFDMNAFAAGLLGGMPDPALSIPGATVRCQWWIRDPQLPPFNSSLSNALEYDVCP